MVTSVTHVGDFRGDAAVVIEHVTRQGRRFQLGEGASVLQPAVDACKELDEVGARVADRLQRTRAGFASGGFERLRYCRTWFIYPL